MSAIRRTLPHESVPEFFDAMTGTANALSGVSYPTVMNVGLALIESVVREAIADGRPLVLKAVRASIDLIEAEYNARPH